MGLKESIRLALEGLRANKMRSILTMLGIIIGIAAVIGILTVGTGLTGEITSSMSSFGASTVYVYLSERSDDAAQGAFEGSAAFMGYGVMTPDEDNLITDEMVQGVWERFGDQIDAIGFTETVGGGQARDGRLYANVSVTGVNAEFQKVNDLDLLAGRFIRDRDLEGQREVCVASDKLVENMFDGDMQKALGSEIQVSLQSGLQTFNIVGVYKYVPQAYTLTLAADKDVSTNLFIPLSTAKHITSAGDGYASLTVLGNSDANTADLSKQIKDYLNRYYVNNDDYNVSTMSMDSVIEQVDSIMGTLSVAISVIAAISLLVGGIGVMNIMLVSVTERTREIGTRKALGATNANIRVQFVVESIIVCLIGGLIGIILGTIMGYVGSTLIGTAAFPSIGSIALAVGFSMAIGVFFGYYPANKAAMLDPIEALRYE